LKRVVARTSETGPPCSTVFAALANVAAFTPPASSGMPMKTVGSRKLPLPGVIVLRLPMA